MTWVADPWWWVTMLALISPTWFVRTANRRTESFIAYGEILALLLLSLVSYLWQGQGLMYHASGIYVCLVLLALISVAAVAREVCASSAMLRLSACGEPVLSHGNRQSISNVLLAAAAISRRKDR